MRYWVYMNGEVPGSYEPAELASIPGFSETTLLCAAGGTVAERNWKRAGEFPDVRDALAGRREASSAAPATPAPTPKGVEDFLDAASTRIFGHVTELMRELEERREERALAQSLSRQLSDLRAELMAARERISHLENRASSVPGLEEKARRLEEELALSRAESERRRERAGAFEAELAAMKDGLDRLGRERDSLSADLAGRASAAEDLAARLGQKEAALARALAVVASLEKAVAGILPQARVGGEGAPLRAQERALPEPPKPEPLPAPYLASPPPAKAPPPAFTTDSGLPDAPVDVPPEGQVRPMPSPLSTALSKVFGWPKP